LIYFSSPHEVFFLTQSFSTQIGAKQRDCPVRVLISRALCSYVRNAAMKFPE